MQFQPDSRYESPQRMRRSDGSARYAFVTFIIRNDSFLPGALLFAYLLGLRDTQADKVCLVSRGVSDEARRALELVFDHVVSVEQIYVENQNRQERQDLPYVFTRFHALRLGHDGDLGLAYDKIVVADADVLPLRAYDHLFTLNTPAGVLNEKREYFLEYNEAGEYRIPDSVYSTGEWKWHEAYNPVCPHGSGIPASITDRVREDSSNLGVNSALYVLTPSIRTFEEILDDIASDETAEIISRFRWPEMQYLTMAWSGNWTNIDVRFCGFKGYPDFRVLNGIHYAGHKPWKVTDPKSLQRMLKFPDNIIWYAHFIKLAGEVHPQLLKIRSLAKLYKTVNTPQIRQMEQFLTDF